MTQKRWLFPTGVERDYNRALQRNVVQPLEASVRANLFPALPVIYAQAAAGRQDADVRDIPPGTGWFETLRAALVQTLVQVGLDDAAITAIVRLVAASVDTFNAKQFHAVLRSVYRVDILTGAPPGLTAALQAFEMENIQLIKSIPVEALGRMNQKIINAVQIGKPMRETQKMLVEEFGVTSRRAELIARDQVGKLNGQLTQLRQEDIGVDSYTWRGVLDSRERITHVEREGKVFQWDKPPDDGHPGQPVQCRCTAEPVLPSWEEMEERYTGVRPPEGTYTAAPPPPPPP